MIINIRSYVAFGFDRAFYYL